MPKIKKIDTLDYYLKKMTIKKLLQLGILIFLYTKEKGIIISNDVLEYVNRLRIEKSELIKTIMNCINDINLIKEIIKEYEGYKYLAECDGDQSISCNECLGSDDWIIQCNKCKNNHYFYYNDKLGDVCIKDNCCSLYISYEMICPECKVFTVIKEHPNHFHKK